MDHRICYNMALVLQTVHLDPTAAATLIKNERKLAEER